MPVTSTETLKQRVRAAYRDGDNNPSVQAWKIQLLGRGYRTVNGKRGGISFEWVGHVAESSPLWREVRG
jgi:hypothetical protein